MSIQCLSKNLLLHVRISACCFASARKGYGVPQDLNTISASKPHFFELHFLNSSFSFTLLVRLDTPFQTLRSRGYTTPDSSAFLIYCDLTTDQVR